MSEDRIARVASSAEHIDAHEENASAAKKRLRTISSKKQPGELFFYDINRLGPTYSGVRFEYDLCIEQSGSRKICLGDNPRGEIKRFFDEQYRSSNLLYGLAGVIWLDLPEPVPTGLCIWVNYMSEMNFKFSNVSLTDQAAMLVFYGASEEIKFVELNHFDLDHLEKFALPSDRVSFGRRTHFAWTNASEDKQIADSMVYLENLIIPQELRDTLPLFEPVHLENAQNVSMKIGLASSITLTGHADAYIPVSRTSIALLVEFKKDGKNLKTPQILAELMSSNQISHGMPVVVLGTDLQNRYEIYWFERNETGTLQAHCFEYFALTATTFIQAIRAFIAGSLIVNPALARLKENWMKIDREFDPDYDEARDGRGSRMNRARITRASNVTQPDLLESTASAVLEDEMQENEASPTREISRNGVVVKDVTAYSITRHASKQKLADWGQLDWTVLGETRPEQVKNLSNFLERYQGLTMDQARDKLMFEGWNEEIEQTQRIAHHDSLLDERLALMSR